MKEVICINTKEIYEDYYDAAWSVNLTDEKGIKKCCLGKQDYSGKVDCEKMVWMHLEDYRKLTEIEKEELDKKVESIQPRKVICLNNAKIFNSILQATKWVNNSNPNVKATSSGIRMCCENKTRSAGRINMIKMKWMYLDEFKETVLNGDKEKTVMLNNSIIRRKCFNG